MSWIDALILGIIQGITEFLPISSDGHLVVVQTLLGYKHSLLAFDVFIHLGTLLALLIYYRHLISVLIRDLFRGSSEGDSRRLISLIIAASIPTGVIGLSLKPLVNAWNTAPLAAALGWLVTGAVLLTADRVKQTPRVIRDLNLMDALLVGIAQGIAVLPGVSRSGLTVATGMYRGVRAVDAANFSFLMAIPAIAGAALVEARDMTGLTSDEWSVYLVGAIAAAIVGYLAIWGLLKLLARRVIKPFAWYCIAAGILTVGIELSK